jgi:hypothetical protein
MNLLNCRQRYTRKKTGIRRFCLLYLWSEEQPVKISAIQHHTDAVEFRSSPKNQGAKVTIFYGRESIRGAIGAYWHVFISKILSRMSFQVKRC